MAKDPKNNRDNEDTPEILAKDVRTTKDTPEQLAIVAGTWPSPIDGYRAAVGGVALVGLVPTGDEKTPYPTGTPLAPGSRFWLQNGYYKSATPT